MYLLDTNVLSEVRKMKAGKSNANVARWSERVDPDTLYISTITVHEIEIGALSLERHDPSQGAILRRWIEEYVLVVFAKRILPIDVSVARRAAALSVPDRRPVMDGLIAATALVHGLIVVTRNVKDFQVTGVPTLDPWSD